MIYGIGIAMSLLAGVAIGVLLTVARYRWIAAQRLRYEQEIAQEAELYAAARTALRRDRPARPPNNTPAGT